MGNYCSGKQAKREARLEEREKPGEREEEVPLTVGVDGIHADLREEGTEKCRGNEGLRIVKDRAKELAKQAVLARQQSIDASVRKVEGDGAQIVATAEAVEKADEEVAPTTTTTVAVVTEESEAKKNEAMAAAGAEFERDDATTADAANNIEGKVDEAQQVVVAAEMVKAGKQSAPDSAAASAENDVTEMNNDILNAANIGVGQVDEAAKADSFTEIEAVKDEVENAGDAAQGEVFATAAEVGVHSAVEASQNKAETVIGNGEIPEEKAKQGMADAVSGANRAMAAVAEAESSLKREAAMKEMDRVEETTEKTAMDKQDQSVQDVKKEMSPDATEIVAAACQEMVGGEAPVCPMGELKGNSIDLVTEEGVNASTGTATKEQAVTNMAGTVEETSQQVAACTEVQEVGNDTTDSAQNDAERVASKPASHTQLPPLNRPTEAAQPGAGAEETFKEVISPIKLSVESPSSEEASDSLQSPDENVANSVVETSSEQMPDQSNDDSNESNDSALDMDTEKDIRFGDGDDEEYKKEEEKGDVDDKTLWETGNALVQEALQAGLKTFVESVNNEENDDEDDANERKENDCADEKDERNDGAEREENSDINSKAITNGNISSIEDSSEHNENSTNLHETEKNVHADHYGESYAACAKPKVEPLPEIVTKQTSLQDGEITPSDEVSYPPINEDDIHCFLPPTAYPTSSSQAEIEELEIEVEEEEESATNTEQEVVSSPEREMRSTQNEPEAGSAPQNDDILRKIACEVTQRAVRDAIRVVTENGIGGSLLAQSLHNESLLSNARVDDQESPVDEKLTPVSPVSPSGETSSLPSPPVFGEQRLSPLLSPEPGDLPSFLPSSAGESIPPPPFPSPCLPGEGEKKVSFSPDNALYSPPVSSPPLSSSVSPPLSLSPESSSNNGRRQQVSEDSSNGTPQQEQQTSEEESCNVVMESPENQEEEDEVSGLPPPEYPSDFVPSPPSPPPSPPPPPSLPPSTEDNPFSSSTAPLSKFTEKAKESSPIPTSESSEISSSSDLPPPPLSPTLPGSMANGRERGEGESVVGEKGGEIDAAASPSLSPTSPVCATEGEGLPEEGSEALI